MTAIEIRPAREADAPLILTLQKLIAEHDRDLDEFAATEDDVRRALFGDHPCAEGLIADLDGRPVGCAVFYGKYSSYSGRTEIYLEDLAVSPGARGRGVGQRLLAHVAGVALQRGASRLEWFVTRSNSSAIEFYRRLGAGAVDHVAVMRLRGEDLAALARRAV